MATAHDTYVANAPAFAVPILEKLRKAVLKGCPQAVEVMKWSQPMFEHHGLLCGMSAHKEHVNFGFWRGNELDDPEGLLIIVGKTRIASLRLETTKDVPAQRVLVAYVKAAMKLNEAAQSKPAAVAVTKPPRLVPWTEM